MLCDNCHNKMATIHLTQVINNQKVEAHLCEYCANEKNYLNFTSPINISDFFNGILGMPAQYKSFSKPITCEGCGMTFDEFNNTGKLGCSKCYEAFQDRIVPLVKRIHGNMGHNGRVPKNLMIKQHESDEVRALKQKLEELIVQEKFEEAAKVRDRLKHLENKKEG